MLKRLFALFLSLLAGGLTGFVLTVLLLRGWFSPWKAVEAPPMDTFELLAMDGEKLWVRAQDGNIYFNSATETCTENCWTVVEEIKREPTPSERGDLPESCLPAPPLLAVRSRIGECKLGEWQDQNTVYALRNNGSISIWRFTSGGEWGVVMLMMATMIGAGLFFSIALLVILIQVFATWLYKQGPR